MSIMLLVCFIYFSSESPTESQNKPLQSVPPVLEDIESLPIAKNEEYRFGYDTKRGVTMEFLR